MNIGISDIDFEKKEVTLILDCIENCTFECKLTHDLSLSHADQQELKDEFESFLEMEGEDIEEEMDFFSVEVKRINNLIHLITAKKEKNAIKN